MTIRKIVMRPPAGDYADELYPRTSADQVVSTDGNVQTDITNLQTGKSATTHNHTLANLTEKAYSSLTGKPTLGTAAALNTGTGTGNVPVLDATGKLDTLVLPALAITNTFPVATEAAMLASGAETGDIAIRSDVSKSFILSALPATTIGNWKELLTPTDVVSSVAGKTGIVTLVAGDVGLGNVTNESKTTMLASPALTGTPTAPTATAATNTTQVATTAFVKSQNYLTAITKALIEAQLTGVISTHSHAAGTPTAHASTHITGGSDIIPNFTSTKSGLVPLSGGGTTKYLRADGTFSVPPDNNTVYTHPTTAGNIHLPSAGATGNFIKYSGVAGTGAWATPTLADISDYAPPITLGATKPTNGSLWFEEI